METNHLKSSCLPVLIALAFGALPAVGTAAVVADGYVVQTASSTIYLDWRKTSGVAVGDRFTLYRSGNVLKHPVTGEVLGNEEKTLGSGMIESLEDKFSTGHMIEQQAVIKAGDRTRWNETAPPAISTAVPPGAVNAGPAEQWRSIGIEGEPIGLTVGDLVGDGHQEIVLATQHSLMVFGWNGQKLESLATFKNNSQEQWLAIDAFDLDNLGHARLFATSFMGAIHRARIQVFEYSNGKLSEVSHLAGFTRVVQRSDGQPILVWQNMAFTSDPRFSEPSLLTAVKGGYKPGSPLQISDRRQIPLFGFAFGDWDGDRKEDVATLEHGERLHLAFGNGAKWDSTENVGGTKNDFSFDIDQPTSFPPRLARLASTGGHDQLLVPHNEPSLGLHLTYFKTYPRSTLTALAWDGQAMTPVWQKKIDSYLADFATGDVMGKGSAQLWIAVDAPGRRTVLLAYPLP